MISKGHVVLTAELLHKILELPEGVLISGMHYESDRDLVRINFHSHKPVAGLTWETEEGSESRRAGLPQKVYDLIEEANKND